MKSFALILWDTLPSFIHTTELELGVGVILGSRLAVPADRLRMVLRFNLAVVIRLAEIELSVCVSLLGKPTSFR
jgi:hypothetical protein